MVTKKKATKCSACGHEEMRVFNAKWCNNCRGKLLTFADQVVKVPSTQTMFSGNGWQSRLKHSTIDVVFRLRLTRPMMEYLCLTATDTVWNSCIYAHNTRYDWAVVEAALVRRGPGAG